MTGLELLDPRYDAEPAYWPRVRAQAGLRADWAWPVLGVQAWFTRTPLLITVLRDAGEVRGVICAGWAGLPVRRHGYVATGRGRWLGILDVRSPGTPSLPGWSAVGGDSAGLLREYARQMRRELGVACRGVLVRQLSDVEAARLSGGLRVVRPTLQLARIHTAGWSSKADWMASLTRKRFRDLRKVFRRVEEDPNLEVRFGPGGDVDPVEVASVLRHNERKYHHWFAPLPHSTGYLAALLGQPGVHVLRYLDKDSGRLVAFGTILDHPEWPVTRTWSALPTDRGGRPGLYLHNYGEVVSWAIRNGKRGLVIGKGMADLKRSLGAELVPQFAAALPVW